ncbi:MAG: DUF3313 domain-containing protein [Phycisphaerae bacterium]|nr:DUF3313 domain-containing protein [Phycisphaerae bacterium]
MTKTLAIKICLLATLSLTGCKAGEAPDSGFNPNPELMSKDKTLPFQRSYWNNNYVLNNYHEIFIVPVNTSHIMAQGSWEKFNLAYRDKEKLEKEIASLADYTRQSFTQAFNDPNNHFTVVNTAGPNTLILQLALVQVVPSRAIMSTIGCVSFIPAALGMVAGAASNSQDVGKGVIAIEGHIRDGGTGEVVAMFADCEHPKSAIIDLKALNWWSPAKIIIDEWAKQLVEVISRPPGTTVKDSPAFKLFVW